MLSFSNDDWIKDFREQNTIWIAGLSDGTSIYYDENRYGANTWIRLKQYCADNFLSIKSLRFGFRSNMYSMPEDKDGYFFCRGVRGDFGGPKTTNYWLLGSIDESTVTITKWHVPEMLAVETEQRLIKDCASECLILK